MCLFYGVWFGCRRSRSGNIHFFRPFSWHTERWGWGVCLHSRKLWQLLQVGLCGGLSHFCALSRWQMVRSNTDLANLQIASPGGGTRSKMARWKRRVLVGCEFFQKKKKTSMAVPWACARAPWPSLIDAIKMFTLDVSPLLCRSFCVLLSWPSVYYSPPSVFDVLMSDDDEIGQIFNQVLTTSFARGETLSQLVR